MGLFQVEWTETEEKKDDDDDKKNIKVM
jgi:hypothetical protein